MHPLMMQFIQKLRNAGSVEPEKLIGDNMQLDISDGRLDGYLPNKQSVLKILNKLYIKYRLTEEEINQTILEFKAKDFEGWDNNVWDAYNDLSIVEIIDRLSGMRNVDDRLNASWDFRKVLASVIKAADAGGEVLMAKLINCLSQLKMCSLGKLINLVYVVQDEVAEDIMISVEQKSDFYDLAFNAINDNDYFKARPLQLDGFIKDWMVAYMEQKPPETWSREVTKIHGIMNQVFSTFQVDSPRGNGTNLSVKSIFQATFR